MKIILMFGEQIIFYNNDYVWNTSVLVHRNMGKKSDANSLSKFYKVFLIKLLQ